MKVPSRKRGEQHGRPGHHRPVSDQKRAGNPGKLCYQIAYNILSRHEDSEECVNDTYVGAWNAIPPAKPTHFRAFLCKITRNLSLKRLAYLRQEKRNQDMAVSLSDLEAILPDDRY